MSTRAYVDLMFAWAHARLGDPTTARVLSEDASLQLSTGEVAHHWLAAAFVHRIGQANRGESHSGEWPTELLTSLANLDEQRLAGINPQYVVDRFRSQSRILEPDIRVDPYAGCKRFASATHFRISELQTRVNPAEFTNGFRSLLEATADPDNTLERLELVKTTAASGRRVPPEVVNTLYAEGLQLYDKFLNSPPPLREADFLFRWLVDVLCDLALARRDGSFLTNAAARLSDWLRAGGNIASRPAGLILLSALLPRLYAANLPTETGLLLDSMQHVGDLFRPPRSSTDANATELQLAASERWLAIGDRGTAVLRRTRDLLLNEGPARMHPAALVRLAESYVQAIGRGRISDFGPELLGLFGQVRRVPSTFTTAAYYSRLHLALSETAIVAVTTGDFRCVRDLHAGLGPAETTARRALLPVLRERIHAWASQDW